MDSDDDEIEFQGDLEDSDDDDEPIGNLKKRRSSQPVSYAEDNEDDDDSDDDIPLADLAKPSPKKAKKNGDAPKKSPKKTETKKKVVKKQVSAVSSSSNKDYEWASMALYNTDSDKGQLIQRLLCRWWYAYEWPDTSKLPEKPPKNYDSLNGFPGVYVCTKGEEVGKIMDMRDKSNCPSFQNFAKKSASELKDMLLKALENQKQELIRVEGAGTATEKEIDRLIKETNKVKPEKADKEAEKVLKASKLSIP